MNNPSGTSVHDGAEVIYYKRQESSVFHSSLLPYGKYEPIAEDI